MYVLDGVDIAQIWWGGEQGPTKINSNLDHKDVCKHTVFCLFGL